jgi:hypothetical protein
MHTECTASGSVPAAALASAIAQETSSTADRSVASRGSGRRTIGRSPPAASTTVARNSKASRSSATPSGRSVRGAYSTAVRPAEPEVRPCSSMTPAARSLDIICEAVGFETPTSSQMRFRVSGPWSSSTDRPARSLTAPSHDGVPVAEFDAMVSNRLRRRAGCRAPRSRAVARRRARRARASR